jgi:hypothetical protein
MRYESGLARPINAGSGSYLVIVVAIEKSVGTVVNLNNYKIQNSFFNFFLNL